MLVGDRARGPGRCFAERRGRLADRDLYSETPVQPRQWAPPPGADFLPDLNDVSRGRQLGAEQHFEQDG